VSFKNRRTIELRPYKTQDTSLQKKQKRRAISNPYKEHAPSNPFDFQQKHLSFLACLLYEPSEVIPNTERKRSGRMLSSSLILASSSPRRIELFKQMGLCFEVYPAVVKEPPPHPNEAPDAYAMRAAKTKAASVLEALHDRPAWIVAADTVVANGTQILGKPKDEADALAMLQKLVGHPHEVITGLAIYHKTKGICDTSAVHTTVWFREATTRQLQQYIKTQEPLDKAGSYAIQGRGAWLVERIQGCYFNVVGLPLHHLLKRLEELGAGAYFDA
jgi:septum formation protein